MKGPQLCNVDLCTGCEACKNICPQSCIEMEPNPEGFLYPVIDFEVCNGCKQCEKSCPVLKRIELNRLDQPLVYACWNKNEAVRMKSSSGGIFSALAEFVLESGGVIFGAAYDEGLHVVHRYVEDLGKLDSLRGSKYVQSEIGYAYRQVKDILNSGRVVLFVGTPCQIAGLHSYLGQSFQKLITVDFICHGVPSVLVLKKYAQSIEKKIKQEIIHIDFRDKRQGWENNSVIGLTSQGNECHLKGRQSSFYHGFILGIFLRQSCYNCPMIGVPRMGDLTIADFWGIIRDDTITQAEVDKGVSLLMINSKDVGQAIFEKVADKLFFKTRTLQEAKQGNSPMMIPAPRPTDRENFFRDLLLMDYETVAGKYLVPPLKRRLLQFIKENIGLNQINKLRTIKKYAKL